MPEISSHKYDSIAGARRTLIALVVIILLLFIGSLIFMVLEGGDRIPEGRMVLAVFPFQSSILDSNRYTGFGEGLASYFGRIDPKKLSVFGPASTAHHVYPDGNNPLETGRQLEADIILVGREEPRVSGAILIAELFQVESGDLLWSREFFVNEKEDLHILQTRIGTEVTEVLDLPR